MLMISPRWGFLGRERDQQNSELTLFYAQVRDLQTFRVALQTLTSRVGLRVCGCGILVASGGGIWVQHTILRFLAIARKDTLGLV